MEKLSEDHAMVAEAAAGFLAQNHPVAAFRALRDSGAPLGYDRAIVGQMAGMGWMGVVLPEDLGGVNFGHRAAGLIAGAMGRNLTAAPFLSTAVIGASVLKHAGGPVAESWGPKLAAGEAVVALAMEEGAKHRPDRIATEARREGDGFVLNGRKSFVVDGVGADRLIVVATLDDAPALFWVDPTAAGVTVVPQVLLDHRNAALVTFEGVGLDGAAMIAGRENAGAVLAAALAAGRAVTAAEQLGVARAAAEATFDYLRTRKQFGMLIGSFQALQHRAADLYCAIEQTDSLVAAALNALDRGADEGEALSRAAKARAALVGRQATEEGVQMHGGIGMTDEMDLGLFMKRDRALSEFLGDAGHHTDWLLRQRGL